MSIGEFARPKGIAVDPAGRIHVVDAAFNNVQIFNDRGDLLMPYGGPGPHRANLDLPADVEIVTDPEAIALFEEWAEPTEPLAFLIFVSSQFGQAKVNVYGFHADERGGLSAP
jgi:hypothetical protein